MEQSRRECGRLRTWVIACVLLLAGGLTSTVASGAGAFTITLPTITLPLLSPPPASGATPPASNKPRARIAQANPFLRRGMWIWEMPASSGGNVRAIIAQARRYGIGTLFIKSGDGSGSWSQFNPSLVSALHAAGLRVCGWQYVYGSAPLAEAQVGANTVHAGADCLVIDAEVEYEGKYYAAQRYITRLRQLIGAGFPVALAGFPYVDFHPGFPYSVFLGPNGAQYNVPQMYWADIGTSVDQVYAHTFVYNRVYGRPIEPLGQVYNAPPPAQIRRFRQFLKVYGSTGVSWWDWQDATPVAWRAISTWVPSVAYTTAVPGMPLLAKGAAGDLVVWAQEHLITAGDPVVVDGGFGPKTLAAVKAFQVQHGLTPDGMLGSATWSALLNYQPTAISWAPGATRLTRRTVKPLTAAAVAAADTGAPSKGVAPPPISSLLPARRNEIPPTLGAGRP
jgi:hypothetical protein